jgi:hypothetical protein
MMRMVVPARVADCSRRPMWRDRLPRYCCGYTPQSPEPQTAACLSNRLAAGFVWAFLTAARLPTTSTPHHHHRKDEDRHATALRNVFIRLLGRLYHGL